MGSTRQPLTADHERNAQRIDAGTLCRSDSPRPGTTNSAAAVTGLTNEQQELLLDLTQLSLDLVGIVEPTPVADGANALISVARGDWFGAGVSTVSLAIPYAGDLAKLAKVDRYVNSIRKSIRMAVADPAFAKIIWPRLFWLRTVLDSIDDAAVPALLQGPLTRLKKVVAFPSTRIELEAASAFFKGKSLLQIAELVPLRTGGKPVALYFGISPGKIDKQFATVDTMLTDTAAGRFLAARLGKTPWRDSEEVWWALSDRVSTIGSAGTQKVHVFVPANYHDAMKMSADDYAKFSKQGRVWREGDRMSSATVTGSTGDGGYTFNRYEDRIFQKVEAMNISGAFFHFIDEKTQRELFQYWRNL